MTPFRVLNTIVIILLLLVNITTAAVFLGGTMSCDVIYADDVIVRAKITALTGWKLGSGPCGSSCSKSSIGRSTHTTRTAIQQLLGGKYFGSWYLEFKDRRSTAVNVQTVDITNNVTSTMKEVVEDVHEVDGWELDRIEFVLDIPSYESYADIIFEGRSWRNSTLQPSVDVFHMQIKIEQPMIRNDTVKIDRVPDVLMKPFYRLVVNRTYHVSDLFSAKDPDDDILLVYRPVYIEAGRKLGSYPFPGLSTDSRKIDHISTMHLKPKDTGIIALSLVSLNRKEIDMKGKGTELELSPTSFLARVPVQFFVEIVEADESPVFTSTYNQRHVLFNGVGFNETFSAKSTNNSRKVVNIEIQLDYLPMTNISEVSYTPDSETAVVKWSPKDKDDHLICATAEDSAGYKSTLMNCHTIVTADFATDHISESDFLASTAMLGFINFPIYGSIVCEVQTNCRFPLTAVSKARGTVLDIGIKSSDISSAKVVRRSRPKSGHKETIDIEFVDAHYGLKSMCFEINDGIHRVEKCIHITVMEKDPCENKPCLNSASCVPLEYNRDFSCKCKRNTEGKRCERVTDLCQSGPCQNNGTCIQPQRMAIIFCICEPGFSGKYCEQGATPCVDEAPNDCKDPQALTFICDDPASAVYCKRSCGLCGSHQNLPSSIFG